MYMNNYVENLFINHYLTDNSIDICQHKYTLQDTAKNKKVVEFGVRNGFSSVCFLTTCKHLTSYDIIQTEQAKKLKDMCPAWEFILGNSLQVDIPECDILFIDSEHTYDHLSRELNLHHKKVKESIVMHDTYTDCMRCAINDFMHKFPEWQFTYDTPVNYGLTIISKL